MPRSHSEGLQEELGSRDTGRVIASQLQARANELDARRSVSPTGSTVSASALGAASAGTSTSRLER